MNGLLMFSKSTNRKSY